MRFVSRSFASSKSDFGAGARLTDRLIGERIGKMPVVRDLLSWFLLPASGP
jgi:hypothetical protein